MHYLYKKELLNFSNEPGKLHNLFYSPFSSFVAAFMYAQIQRWMGSIIMIATFASQIWHKMFTTQIFMMLLSGK